VGHHVHSGLLPEARGRSERVFRTLQDRLPKELALTGITDMAAANQYLVEQFVSAYNQRVAVSAAEAGTAFVPWIGSNLPRRTVSSPTTRRYGMRAEVSRSHPTRIASIL